MKFNFVPIILLQNQMTLLRNAQTFKNNVNLKKTGSDLTHLMQKPVNCCRNSSNLFSFKGKDKK